MWNEVSVQKALLYSYLFNTSELENILAQINVKNEEKPLELIYTYHTYRNQDPKQKRLFICNSSVLSINVPYSLLADKKGRDNDEASMRHALPDNCSVLEKGLNDDLRTQISQWDVDAFMREFDRIVPEPNKGTALYELRKQKREEFEIRARRLKQEAELLQERDAGALLFWLRIWTSQNSDNLFSNNPLPDNPLPDGK